MAEVSTRRNVLRQINKEGVYEECTSPQKLLPLTPWDMHIYKFV